MAEKKECLGSEMYKGRVHSVDACGSLCQGVSSMFIFGTNDFGYEGSCYSAGCNCYCETSATNEGTCDIWSNYGYRLYKYVSGDYPTLYN